MKVCKKVVLEQLEALCFEGDLKSITAFSKAFGDIKINCNDGSTTLKFQTGELTTELDLDDCVVFSDEFECGFEVLSWCELKSKYIVVDKADEL